MRLHYTIASPAAIVGGLMAASGAIALLVRDAFVTGWTVELALMPVVVSITILAGVLHLKAARSGRLLAAVWLSLLAISGSCYVVYETMGRRAEVRDASVATASDTEKQRQHLSTMLREAEEILAKHRKDRDAECASGKGKLCDGKTYTVSTWEHAVMGYETRLSKLPARKPVDPKAERVAAVFSLFTDAKDVEVKKAVALFEPFALPLFLELGSIILFSYAIALRRDDGQIATPHRVEQVIPATERIAPPDPSGGGMTKIEAERDLVMLLALGKPIPSQEWLVDRWRMEGKKGTVSKWLSDWQERGLITRTQAGHCKQIEAA